MIDMPRIAGVIMLVSVIMYTHQRAAEDTAAKEETARHWSDMQAVFRQFMN